MYVPTSYNGSNRYGPYRDYNDLAYNHWGNLLIDEINSMPD